MMKSGIRKSVATWPSKIPAFWCREDCCHSTEYLMMGSKTMPTMASSAVILPA